MSIESHPAIRAEPYVDDSNTHRVVVLYQTEDGRILLGTETRGGGYAVIDYEVGWTPRNEVRMGQMAQSMGERLNLPVYEVTRSGGLMLIQRVRKNTTIPD